MYKNESLDEKLLGTLNNSLNGPAIRNIYLRKATEEYDAGNISKSIFYQLESLCLTSRAKHFVQKKSVVAPEYISKDSDDKLIQFAKNLLKESKTAKDQNENSYIEPIYEKDPSKGYQNILKFCDEIPKEWTVIHICREFNPNTTFSLQSEISCNDDSIFLTVLNYPKTDKLKTKPFCIHLKNQSNDIFQKFVEISTNLKDRIRFDKDSKDNRQFWQGLSVVEEEMKVLLKSFKEFIGPWISLFSGDICNPDIQQSLFDAVDDFSQKYKLNDEKRNILNLIVRRVNLLSESHLKDICEYFANNEDNKEVLYKKLYEFLKVIKAKYDFDEFEYSPCILIVDETLDHFFWEMLNTRQEFCRISSFHIFKTLFQKYKNRIHKGYVQIPIESGNCLINPDKTLDRMEKRMNIFFKYWLSHWKCTSGEIPTSSIFLNCIQTANCFVYCGHGSGLQFLNGQHIAKLCTESVVFLFGCDSVRLKSDGIHSEMSGSHIYYHAALCPAVLGNLLPALDYQLDSISALLLSIWIPSSKRKTHWIHLNKNNWQKGENISESNISKSSLPEFEPRLTKILTFIKSDNSNNLYNRVGLISRGLPIWNSTSSKN